MQISYAIGAAFEKISIPFVDSTAGIAENLFYALSQY